MQFKVTVYRTNGGTQIINLDASNDADANRQAVDMGFRVLEISRGATSLNLPMGDPRHENSFDLLRFSQELLALLQAGLSIIEALNAIARNETPSGKRALVEQLIREIREGKAFSVALGSHPNSFPPLFRALTAASERTGHLSDALSRYIDYRVQMDALKKKLVTSALYPMLLILTGGLVVLFLMGYVVPRFSRIYEGFGREIPLMSALLFSWGKLVGRHGLEILLGIVLVIGAFIYYFRRHHFWNHLLRRASMLRPIAERLHLFQISRFYRTVGLLLQGGIPLITALEMARTLLGDSSSMRLTKAIFDIRAGMSCSESMDRYGLAPRVAVDLLRTGEKTGALGDKMISIAEFFDEALTRWAEWFSRLFEPLLMLIMGLFIAFVVVLLYLPIFELASSLQ